MCCNYGERQLVAWKEREKSNSTGNIQVATDGSGTDRLRGSLVVDTENRFRCEIGVR
jgi:hypothetical protein